MPNEPLLPKELVDNATPWEYAKLKWQAECENAERLSKRINLLMTALVALFGLGIFKIEWLRPSGVDSRIEPDWVAWLIKGALTVAIVLFSWALYRLTDQKWKPKGLTPRQEDEIAEGEHASVRMEIPHELLTGDFEAQKYVSELFNRVYIAAINLRIRNVIRKKRIERAEQLIRWGIVCIILSVVLHLWWSGPPFIADEIAEIWRSYRKVPNNG